jgi:hypothetical protein
MIELLHQPALKIVLLHITNDSSLVQALVAVSHVAICHASQVLKCLGLHEKTATWEAATWETTKWEVARW